MSLHDYIAHRAKIDHGAPSMAHNIIALLIGRNTTRNNQTEMSCQFLILLLVVQKSTPSYILLRF